MAFTTEKPRVTRFFARLILTLSLALLVNLTGCHERSVKPGINKQYKKNVDVEEWRGRFETESREIFRERQGIVEALDLKPGMIMADIGSGTGLFTRPLSEAVGPTGKVYAVDVTPEFIDAIGKIVAEDGLSNVETVLTKEDSIDLPQASIDFAFICDTYHHFEYPRSTMTSLHRALKSGGEIVVIDFKRIPGVTREWLMKHVRAGQEVFTNEIISFGFEPVGSPIEIEGLEENYTIRFRKID